MAEGVTVLIGPRTLARSVTARPAAEGTELLVFSEDDVRAAVEQIVSRRPRVIALQEKFAFSPRGTALTHRIALDAALAGTEVVVIDAAGEASRLQPAGRTTWLPLDGSGTRRVPRIRIREGYDVQIDGTPAALVDLSTLGAQVVSPMVLKPGQRVRVVLAVDPEAIKAAGTVAWASFEIPRGAAAPQYRAGLEFAEADPEPLLHFCLEQAAGSFEP